MDGESGSRYPHKEAKGREEKVGRVSIGVFGFKDEDFDIWSGIGYFPVKFEDKMVAVVHRRAVKEYIQQIDGIKPAMSVLYIPLGDNHPITAEERTVFTIVVTEESGLEVLEDVAEALSSGGKQVRPRSSWHFIEELTDWFSDFDQPRFGSDGLIHGTVIA